MPTPIRLLIVTNNPGFQHGLQWSLEPLNDITIVGVATNSQDALTMATQIAIDVLLVDIRTPGFEGLATTQALARPTIAVGMVLLHLTRGATSDGQPVLIGTIVAIPQNSTPETLVGSIRIVAKGSRQT